MTWGKCVETWNRPHVEFRNCEFLCGGVALQCHAIREWPGHFELVMTIAS